MPSILNYDVEINGAIYTTTSLTSVTVPGRAPLTNYTCRVRSRDLAGNVSEWSTPLVVTTLATPPDETVPTNPTGLTITNLSTTGFHLTWTASTDNVSVTKYQVRVNGSTLADESTTLLRVVTDLTENTDYTVEVRAGDAAGNWSSWVGVETTTLTEGSLPTPLVAYAFNEDGGNTSADAIGSRHLTSGIQSVNSWSEVPKNGAGALVGAGVVPIPNTSGLETASRTLMFWAYRYGDQAGWFSQFYISAQDTAAWGIGYIGSQHYCRIRIGSTNTNLVTTSLSLNTWTHVAITYDGVTFRGYINGVQFSSSPVTGTIATATGGASLFDSQNPMVVIDDYRAFDTALTAEQIVEFMNTPV